jgi:hypothetical protein
VREGMETVAPHDGKVILRRAANTEMGVAGPTRLGDRQRWRPHVALGTIAGCTGHPHPDTRRTSSHWETSAC